MQMSLKIDKTMITTFFHNHLTALIVVLCIAIVQHLITRLQE